METVALIKGMFINSHIDRLRELKGTEGVYELNIRLGKFDGFNTLDDYPVSLEVKVIEHVLDLISEQEVPTHLRAFRQAVSTSVIFQTPPTVP